MLMIFIKARESHLLNRKFHYFTRIWAFELWWFQDIVTKSRLFILVSMSFHGCTCLVVVYHLSFFWRQGDSGIIEGEIQGINLGPLLSQVAAYERWRLSPKINIFVKIKDPNTLGVGLFTKMEDRGPRYHLGSVYYCHRVIDINGLDISPIAPEDTGVFFLLY